MSRQLSFIQNVWHFVIKFTNCLGSHFQGFLKHILIQFLNSWIPEKSLSHLKNLKLFIKIFHWPLKLFSMTPNFLLPRIFDVLLRQPVRPSENAFRVVQKCKTFPFISMILYNFFSFSFFMLWNLIFSKYPCVLDFIWHLTTHRKLIFCSSRWKLYYFWHYSIYYNNRPTTWCCCRCSCCCSLCVQNFAYYYYYFV